MTARIAPLAPEDADAIRALLLRDVRHNVYLLGLWEEYGGVCSPTGGTCFHGAWEDSALTAVVFVGGNGGLVVPSASSPEDLGPLVSHLSKTVTLQASVGEKSAVDALLKAFGVRPRFVSAQRLYAVSADDLGPFTNPTLRLAREEDLPQLLPLAAGAVRETMKHDPLASDPVGFEHRVRRRVKAKRTYVLEEGGQLVFKIDVGSRSQHGAELEGLYTLPEKRRLGHATLSLGQISRHLLSSLPRLTLRVDDSDPSLAGVARKVGFVGGRPMKAVVVDG